MKKMWKQPKRKKICNLKVIFSWLLDIFRKLFLALRIYKKDLEECEVLDIEKIIFGY